MGDVGLSEDEVVRMDQNVPKPFVATVNILSRYTHKVSPQTIALLPRRWTDGCFEMETFLMGEYSDIDVFFVVHDDGNVPLIATDIY